MKIFGINKNKGEHTMKLLTINVHSWLEENQLEKLNILAKVIVEKNYDVVAMQEVNQLINSEDVQQGIKTDNFGKLLLDKIREYGEEGYSYYWTYSHIGFDKFEEGLAILAKGEVVAGTLTGIATAILKLGIISVAVIGVNMLMAGEVSVLVYIAFLMLTASIYLPIEGIITFMSMIVMLDAVVGRIKEIKTMPVQEGKKDIDIKNYDIEFKDVYFGYDDYSVINGVSFTAKQGEITALIGSSGSGKTTLTKLAARFWDIDKGKILIGGEDIGKIDPETLFKNFSIVFQDVILFNSSIKDNIKIGKKDATDEEIIRAAKIARCYEFIDKMPDGIDTVIGENGQRLSGGERQRISIARAILKDAPIILLDEATASLDVENESLIQEALSELINTQQYEKQVI